MSKTPFTKQAASPEQLLAKWTSQALAYLRYVGAYRLKGYWFHLVDPTTKRFPAGYTFARIAERCEFDRELRAATIEAIDHHFFDPQKFWRQVTWSNRFLVAHCCPCMRFQR